MKQNTKIGHLNLTTLAEILVAQISDGRYAVGDRFPTEQELQEHFGVGRHTVREALKVLTEKGMLGRRRKTGTIVLAKKPVADQIHSLRDIHGLLDFASNTLLNVKYEGFVSNLSSSIIGFTEDPNNRWYRVAGLRRWRNKEESLCWSEIIVPEAYAPDRKNVQGESKPIYERVMETNGLKLGYVEQDVSAVALPDWMAVELKAEPHSPALLLKRRYVSSSGETFEISHNYYPSERYAVRSVIRQRE
jgi:GntR family transcriptional regulator